MTQRSQAYARGVAGVPFLAQVVQLPVFGPTMQDARGMHVRLRFAAICKQDSA